MARIGSIAAAIGASLVALSLAGGSQSPKIPHKPTAEFLARIQQHRANALNAYAHADFAGARDEFLEIVRLESQRPDDPGRIAMAWNNAGAASLAGLHFRDAFQEFNRARKLAAPAQQWLPLAMSLQNLASLHSQLGQFPMTAAIAAEALQGPAADADANTKCALQFQLAHALMQTGQAGEGVARYQQALECAAQKGTLEASVRIWSNYGTDLFDAGRTDEADAALTEGLRVSRVHHLNAATYNLLGLAKVRARQGRPVEAATFYENALLEPPSLVARWTLFADRAEFRLAQGDTEGALGDFREARRLVRRLRADIVPADQDRVSFEAGAGRVIRGFIETGNRIGSERSDETLLRQTFDAAEEDRLWSLRALIPASNDWRTRLPEQYWTTLARYQSLERNRLAAEQSGVAAGDQVERDRMALDLQLQEIEASAAGGLAESTGAKMASAAQHVQALLDSNSVLFSFHTAQQRSWVWAVTQDEVQVFPLVPAGQLADLAQQFLDATRTGASNATALSRQLFLQLFGPVPKNLVARKRWLLELDGPLYALPFAALVTSPEGRPAEYVLQHATLQTIPGALLLKRGRISRHSGMIAVGDPVYNAADSRFTGTRKELALTLPRLSGTARELSSCARVWGCARTVLLNGNDASDAGLRKASATRPGILHFATHVLTAPGDYQSGMIALSLNRGGELSLLDAKEIVARPSPASLIVMNGCHSARADALPEAGLMGLTRAWIAAGADAVLATQWDIVDSAGESLATNFYTHLAKNGNPAEALRYSQLRALRAGGANGRPSVWASYSLLSRLW